MEHITQEDGNFHKIFYEVQKALHLEHWNIAVEFKSDDTNVVAEVEHSDAARRAHINFYERFWEEEPEEQLRTIIHELVHCIMMPENDVARKIMEVHSLEANWYAHWDHCNELVTDHLEAVIYDMIADKFKTE